MQKYYEILVQSVKQVSKNLHTLHVVQPLLNINMTAGFLHVRKIKSTDNSKIYMIAYLRYSAFKSFMLQCKKFNFL